MLPWDEALDLVAAELKRVKATYGNDAIYASSGWGSAGVFHHAATQLSRFLNGFGGFVRQVTNYSFGAASVIVDRSNGAGSSSSVLRSSGEPRRISGDSAQSLAASSRLWAARSR